MSLRSRADAILNSLAAFHDEALLQDCYEAALSHGYLWHEFGDVHLLLP